MTALYALIGPTCHPATGFSGISSCDMGAPFVGNGGIEKLPLSNAWGARLFSTHPHQVRPTLAGFLLPEVPAARGKVRGLGRAGVVGAFSLVHGCSVVTRSLGVYHNPLGAMP